MEDSLNRVHMLQKEVGFVKIADRITNLQDPPKYWSKEKVRNYCEEAKLISNTLKDRHHYLNQRLKVNITEYAQKTAKF